MLTKVAAYSAWASSGVLLLDSDGREETDLLQITNIDGIGPIKATTSGTPYATFDGVSYTGVRVDSRNIVLTIRPNPDWNVWTHESLRKLLYSYFMTKLYTRLVFFTEEKPPVEIFGYVDDFGANLFSKDLEYQISIICPSPYFKTIVPTVLDGASIADVSVSGIDITYNGDIEAGFHLDVRHDISPDASYIDVRFRESSFVISEGPTEVARFEMNSVPGEKYARNVNLINRTIDNLLSKVQSNASWPTLQPGVNRFGVITDWAGRQAWELTYYEYYGGL